jgi:C-terminal processing protease CtpA/Prc
MISTIDYPDDTFYTPTLRPTAVVGRQSAGTNGNITGLMLPTGLGFSFTGLEVLFPDSSRFHGVGIVPDVLVEPTRMDSRRAATSSWRPRSSFFSARDSNGALT